MQPWRSEVSLVRGAYPPTPCSLTCSAQVRVGPAAHPCCCRIGFWAHGIIGPGQTWRCCVPTPALLPGKGFLKLQGSLGNRIQKSSVKCTCLAPLQIKPPHAGSWQIVSILQTPVLAASDQIQTNLPYPCCVCDLLGVPQVQLAKECKQPWPEQCCPVGEAEGSLVRAHLY